MDLQHQFILINLHFAINLLAALVFFSIAWLYFDAWVGKKNHHDAARWLGFIFLSLAFLAHSTIVEQSLFQSAILNPGLAAWLNSLFQTLGFSSLIIGQLTEPLQPLPAYRRSKTAPLLLFLPTLQLISFLQPLLAVSVAFLYLRRATIGLEHHLKPIAKGLFFLTGYQVLSLATTFRTSDNIHLAQLTAAFQPLWLFEHLLLLISIIILSRWVWGYLVKRLETQFLIIFTTGTLILFLITTIFFTSTSLSELKSNTLQNLQINAQILSFAISSQKQASSSTAQLIASSPDLISAVAANNLSTLDTLATQILTTNKQTELTIVAKTGEILVRAEAPDQTGGSLSDHPLIQSALIGKPLSSLVTTSGVIAPELVIQASAPILQHSQIIGAVLTGNPIDNAYVDGLKAATGLDSSIYSGNIRSATTFVAPDGKSRWLGIQEDSPQVLDTVITQNKLYTGSVTILNLPFFSAYLPLTDHTNHPVGMIFVGLPQSSLLVSIKHNIEQTFSVTVILLIASVVPSFFLSRYLTRQLH